MMTFVGLGNPGKKYEKTRHNVGFMFVDYLQNILQTSSFKHQTKHNLELSTGGHVQLIKPQTFMNNSGIAVQSYLSFYDKEWKDKLDTLYVVHDDLDIEFGNYKIQFGKGPHVHNGTSSLYDHLHTNQVWHIRIGIDGRGGVRTIPGRDYVLGTFTTEEQQRLTDVFTAIRAQLAI